MNGLFQTICRIGIFMICAQTVIHFRPEESYEKYLRLLVSVMVLIQLFLPVGRLLFHGDSQELARKSEEFLGELEAEISAAEIRAYESDALLEQMTLEEIRRRVEEQTSWETVGVEGRSESEETNVNGQISGSGPDRAGEDGTDGVDGIDRIDRIDGIGRIEEIGRIEVENIRVRLGADTPE